MLSSAALMAALSNAERAAVESFEDDIKTPDDRVEELSQHTEHALPSQVRSAAGSDSILSRESSQVSKSHSTDELGSDLNREDDTTTSMAYLETMRSEEIMGTVNRVGQAQLSEALETTAHDLALHSPTGSSMINDGSPASSDAHEHPLKVNTLNTPKSAASFTSCNVGLDTELCYLV